MTARLHVLLGEGGVGKTTLAAAYALALARKGRRVGLLGVDPAGRLRGALRLADLPEVPVEIQPGLHAALLRPEQTLRRWALEDLGQDSELLIRNPFFVALTERLGSATDALAALRIAEWAERDAALDDLVVDTAPGLHGLEFLAKPERLLAFLNGRLLHWLSNAVKPGETGRRVLRGISQVAGGQVLVQLAQFSVLIRQIAARMVTRLEFARTWLREKHTEILLVCVARPDAAKGVEQLANELAQLRLRASAVVLNRALPPGLLSGAVADDTAFVRYVRALLRIQQETVNELALGFRVAQVPVAAGLDAASRLEALEALGDNLIASLEADAQDLRGFGGQPGVGLA